MNSYPTELLAQLAPVMFVAGLGVPQAPTPSTSQPPITQSLTPPPTKSQDPFAILIVRLRDALLAQRKVAIWQPQKSQSFHILLVDKHVRFPLRKAGPSDDAQTQTAPTNTHSPLSPLTPTSPLYPDGLIAPIWIRKHTTLLPSVFVLFLRIWEPAPVAARSPLDLPDVEKEREREMEERKRDAELSVEIASRKKSTAERGIKLTVVLMATRKLLGGSAYCICVLIVRDTDGLRLDDPALDARLTYIRRQSGLDSRASLFVLSPVSPAELGDFVSRCLSPRLALKISPRTTTASSKLSTSSR
jgi:trafficking protein particle complex subunit 11